MKTLTKKALVFLSTAVLLLAMFPAVILPVSAETVGGTCGENLTWSLDTETGVLTIDGEGEMAHYNSSDNLTAPWYEYRESITALQIGDQVTSIGYDAFKYCESLASITIPDSVTSFGHNAFYGTAYYNDDQNWEDGVLYIGNHLIVAKGDITGDYTVKAGTKRIADYAFYYRKSLASITIPDGVTSIGDGAFADCYSLASITIPDSVTSIGKRVFSGCSNLASITIPQGVKEIESYVFSGCDKLASITIPDGVTSIGDWAFYDCRSLASVTIPDSVTSIGDSAFYYCYSLASITIPDSVTSIGDNAFFYCSSLASITIPNSVTSIGRSAFSGTAYYKNDQNWEQNWEDCVLYIGNHLIDAKTNITGDYTVKAGTKTIADEAFYDCSHLASITIPDSVTSIGSGAFSGTAYYNNNQNWKDGVLYIGNHLIDAKTNITGDYTVKAGTKTIADSAFYNCSSLASITIPDSVKSIGKYAFYGCSKLTDIYYLGTQSEWDAISKSGADIPETATVHFLKDIAALGDVDGDTEITSTDARLVLQYYAKKIDGTKLDISVADVDGDTEITSTDARLILQYYAKKITEFPTKK